MMKNKTMRWLCFLLLLCVSAVLINPKSVHKDSSVYWYCPFCHGQTLWESDHPQAVALVEQIEQWEKEGCDPQDIESYLELSYGSRMFRTQGPTAMIVVLLGLWWYQKTRGEGCD